MQITHRENDVILEIHAQFASILYIGPLVLSKEDDEEREESEFFNQKKWTDLSAQDLWDHAEAYSFFTEAAFWYFLPAVMSQSLIDFELSHLAVDRVLSRLIELTQIDDDREKVKNCSFDKFDLVRKWLLQIEAKAGTYGWTPRLRQIVHNIQ